MTNFYQKIFQKVRHPIYANENPRGFHDNAVYVDPKQIIVVLEKKTMWAQLKIETVMALQHVALSNPGTGDRSPKEDEGEEQSLNTIETEAQFFDVFETYDSDEINPDDIIRVYDIQSEGFSRKEVHMVVEMEVKIQVLQLTQLKNGSSVSFSIEKIFAFEKQRIDL